MARRIIPKAILDRALRDAHMYGKANLTLNHAQLKWLDEAQDLLLQEYDVSAPASPESGAGGETSHPLTPEQATAHIPPTCRYCDTRLNREDFRGLVTMCMRCARAKSTT